MPPGNPRFAEHMFLMDFKYRYSALIQLQVNDIPDHLFERQGTNLVIGMLRHLLHSLTKLRDAKFHTVKAYRLNAHFKLASQLAVCNKGILVDQLNQPLVTVFLG